MSKKYLLFAVLVGLLTATAVSAQTNVYAQLREALNRLSSQLRQLAAVGAVSVSQTDLSTLQTLINNLRAKISSLTPTTPATPGLTPEPFPPAPPAGSCPGGATMPQGSNGQTLRCDGTRWVAASNLRNDGSRVSIGGVAYPVAKLRVSSSANDNFPAVVGTSVGGGPAIWGITSGWGGTTAVQGDSENGIGVYGTSGADHSQSAGVWGHNNTNYGIAVKASQGLNGYGFYQSGANAKNYFEGKVGIGQQNPQTSLHIAGNIINESTLRIDAASGDGNAYACFSLNGTLFRSPTPCR